MSYNQLTRKKMSELILSSDFNRTLSRSELESLSAIPKERGKHGSSSFGEHEEVDTLDGSYYPDIPKNTQPEENVDTAYNEYEGYDESN